MAAPEASNNEWRETLKTVGRALEGLLYPKSSSSLDATASSKTVVDIRIPRVQLGRGLLQNPDAAGALLRIQHFLEFCADNIPISKQVSHRLYSAICDALLNICHLDLPQSPSAALFLVSLIKTNRLFLEMVIKRVVYGSEQDLLNPMWNITTLVDERVKKRLAEIANFLAREMIIPRSSFEHGLTFQVHEDNTSLPSKLSSKDASFCQPFRVDSREVDEKGVPGKRCCVSYGKRNDPVDVFAHGQLSLNDDGIVALVKYALEFEFRCEKLPSPIEITAWHSAKDAAKLPNAAYTSRNPFDPELAKPRDLTCPEDADVLIDFFPLKYSEKINVPFFLSSNFPTIHFRARFTGHCSVALVGVRLKVLSQKTVDTNLVMQLAERGILMQTDDYASRTPTPAVKSVFNLAAPIMPLTIEQKHKLRPNSAPAASKPRRKAKSDSGASSLISSVAGSRAAVHPGGSLNTEDDEVESEGSLTAQHGRVSHVEPLKVFSGDMARDMCWQYADNVLHYFIANCTKLVSLR